MNLFNFIARRFNYIQKGEKSISRPATKVAFWGMVLGTAVMIISVSIIIGFKSKVSDQIVGFGSHIQLFHQNFQETSIIPIVNPDSVAANLKTIPGVKTIQKITTKPGVLKHNDEFQGVMLKGVDSSFDWDFFAPNLVDGKGLNLPDSTTNGAIISASIAKTFNLNIGDGFLTYFIESPMRVRKFVVESIYSTNFSEFDNSFIIVDSRVIQQLYGWQNSEISTIEILVDDFSKIYDVQDDIYRASLSRFDENSNVLTAQSIQERFPVIFEWLDLLDLNVWVVLALMIAVSVFNMISGVIIVILEKTNTIGILKSLGATNWSIRKIFLYQSFYLIFRGILWGNIIAITILLTQHLTHILPLNPEYYYVSYVPVAFNFTYWILLNVGIALISLGCLILPTYLITHISPTQAMRFD